MSNSLRQLGMGEGHQDQLDPRIEPAQLDDGVAGITRGEQHLEHQPMPSRLVHELALVKSTGLSRIGEEEIDAGAPGCCRPSNQGASAGWAKRRIVQ